MPIRHCAVATTPFALRDCAGRGVLAIIYYGQRRDGNGLARLGQICSFAGVGVQIKGQMAMVPIPTKVRVEVDRSMAQVILVMDRRGVGNDSESGTKEVTTAGVFIASDDGFREDEGAMTRVVERCV